MKSTILASVLCAVLLSAVEASPSAHHKSLLSFRSRHASHKRHIALTSSSAQSKMIKKRKTPGGGDVVAEPANLAQGSYTSKQGCAIWHTVGEGEVCLGLIDKSSSGFNLDKFLQFNPSLNKACSNLEVGQAYCVDTVAGNAAAPKANTSSDKKTDVTPAKSLLAGGDKPQADASRSASSGADEDCEDEEDDSTANEDDEDCEEEEDDSADTVITVKTQSKAAAPAKQNSPVEQAPAQQPKPQAPAPAQPKPEVKTSSSIYVAPAPTSTYQAPAPAKETPSPSPQPEAPSSGGGAMQFSNQPATYYYQNGNAGSCGDYNSDDAIIVAVKSGIMGSQLCGKSVTLRNTATGKSITAKIADTCPTCENQGIDLSKGAFEALLPDGAGLGQGVINVDYSIL